jgi:hypothetical protein
MTVPTFLSVSPSSITTSGTFAVSYSGTALPIANGGTGSTSQNFVDLTSIQTAAGAKTFSSALTISASSAQLKLGTNLTISSPTQSSPFTLTIPNITANDTVATLGFTQTFSGTNTFSSALTLSASSAQLKLGTNLTISSPTQSSAFTLTIPNIIANDTLVTQAFTQTLTNKTIAAGSNTITGLTNTNLSGTAGITGANIASATITSTQLATTAFDQVTVTGGAGTAAAVARAPAIVNTEVSGQALSATTLVALRYALSSDSGSTAGQMWKADYNTASNDNFYVIGLAYPASSVSASGNVTVTEFGVINVPSHGFTTGVPLYLGASGALTTTAPSTSLQAIVRVGMVKDANNIFVNVQVVGVN